MVGTTPSCVGASVPSGSPDTEDISGNEGLSDTGVSGNVGWGAIDTPNSCGDTAASKEGNGDTAASKEGNGEGATLALSVPVLTDPTPLRARDSDGKEGM